MLARLFLILPFDLTVPEGEQFSMYEYVDEGYGVRAFPPIRSDRPRVSDVDELRLDGVPAFQADALRIDFHRETFGRAKDGPYDPPEGVIGRAINSFLIRLRHVARAAQIRPLDYPWGTWRIQYLNDDGTELDVDERLVRGRGALHVSFGWIALNKHVWEDVHRLPPDYEPPPWEELLLDAQSDMPRIGPAVVLAATALEVFVSRILNKLAEAGTAPRPLWDWINKRGDYLREPTVEEQYDALLKFFTGHSLKDEPNLWESFRNLKTARNSFVHEGVATVGGTAVSIDTARKLVSAASEIISKVREWLPQPLHWPVFKHTIQIQARKKLT